MNVPTVNMPDLAPQAPQAASTPGPANPAACAPKAVKAAPSGGPALNDLPQDEGDAMDFEAALEAAVAISNAPAQQPAQPTQVVANDEASAAAEGTEAVAAEPIGSSVQLGAAERALATVPPMDLASSEAFVVPEEAAQAYEAMDADASDVGMELPEGFEPVAPQPTNFKISVPEAAASTAGLPSDETPDLQVNAPQAAKTSGMDDLAVKADTTPQPAPTPATAPAAAEAPAPEATAQATIVSQTNESTKPVTNASSAAPKPEAHEAGDAASVVHRADIAGRYGVKNSERSPEKAPESLRAAAEKNLEGGRSHPKSTPLSSERGAEGIAPRQALPEEKDAAREIPAYQGAAASAEKNPSGITGKSDVSPTAPRTQVEQVQQVAQAAREGLANGKRVMEIELKPEGLGSVTLRISGNPNATNPANELRLDISVSSQEAHSLLSRHLDDLKSVLGKWDINLSPVSQQQVRSTQEGSNGSAPDGRNPQDGQRRPQYQQWFERREAGAEAFSEHFDSAVGN